MFWIHGRLLQYSQGELVNFVRRQHKYKTDQLNVKISAHITFGFSPLAFALPEIVIYENFCWFSTQNGVKQRSKCCQKLIKLQKFLQKQYQLSINDKTFYNFKSSEVVKLEAARVIASIKK